MNCRYLHANLHFGSVVSLLRTDGILLCIHGTLSAKYSVDDYMEKGIVCRPGGISGIDSHTEVFRGCIAASSFFIHDSTITGVYIEKQEKWRYEHEKLQRHRDNSEPNWILYLDGDSKAVQADLYERWHLYENKLLIN